jgi:NADPH2:quinone reductase
VGRRRDTGQLVWAFADGLGLARDGAFAEAATAAEAALAPVPDGADPALAVALGIAGMAGWMPVAWRAPVREDDRVLVLGATGTAGLVALQGARLLGAKRVVAAGRSDEGLARARELGADEVVRLDAEDLAGAFKEACGGDGPTLVVDPLWGEPAQAAVAAAAPRARIVNLGQSAGPEATLTSAAVRGKELNVLGYSDFALSREVRDEYYAGLVRHAECGEIRLDLERVPLESVADAWAKQAAGAGKKLVLVP